ncbi:MAG: hypothetical protein MHM6MM_004636 [Cercozoa sp. M6MM]
MQTLRRPREQTGVQRDHKRRRVLAPIDENRAISLAEALNGSSFGASPQKDTAHVRVPSPMPSVRKKQRSLRAALSCETSVSSDDEANETVSTIGIEVTNSLKRRSVGGSFLRASDFEFDSCAATLQSNGNFHDENDSETAETVQVSTPKFGATLSMQMGSVGTMTSQSLEARDFERQFGTPSPDSAELARCQDGSSNSYSRTGASESLSERFARLKKLHDEDDIGELRLLLGEQSHLSTLRREIETFESMRTRVVDELARSHVQEMESAVEERVEEKHDVAKRLLELQQNTASVASTARTQRRSIVERMQYAHLSTLNLQRKKLELQLLQVQVADLEKSKRVCEGRNEQLEHDVTELKLQIDDLQQKHARVLASIDAAKKYRQRERTQLLQQIAQHKERQCESEAAQRVKDALDAELDQQRLIEFERRKRKHLSALETLNMDYRHEMSEVRKQLHPQHRAEMRELAKSTRSDELDARELRQLTQQVLQEVALSRQREEELTAVCKHRRQVAHSKLGRAARLKEQWQHFLDAKSKEVDSLAQEIRRVQLPIGRADVARRGSCAEPTT